MIGISQGIDGIDIFTGVSWHTIWYKFVVIYYLFGSYGYAFTESMCTICTCNHLVALANIFKIMVVNNTHLPESHYTNICSTLQQHSHEGVAWPKIIESLILINDGFLGYMGQR